MLKPGLCVHQEHQGEEVDASSTPNQDAGRLFDQSKHKPREVSRFFGRLGLEDLRLEV